jgi:hypothetical protein
MTFNFNAAGDSAAVLENLGYDQRERYPYTHATVGTAPPSIAPSASLTTMAEANRQSLSPASAWLPLDLTGSTFPSPTMDASSPDDSQDHSSQQSSASSPLQHQPSPFQTAAHPHAPAMFPNWPISQPQQHQPHLQTAPGLPHFIQDTSSVLNLSPFATTFATPALDYVPATTQASLQLQSAFNTLSPVDHRNTQMQQWSMGMANWQDFETAMAFPTDGLQRMGSIGSNSPTGTYLEVLSLPSGSDNGWSTVDVYPSYETFQQTQRTHNAAIFNPSQTLHLRTNSDSSQSDGNSLDFGSYEEVSFTSPFSPSSDGGADASSSHRNCAPGDAHKHAHEVVSPSSAVAPMPIKAAAPSSRPLPGSGSGSVSASPPARRNSGPRKSPIAKTTKTVIRRTSTGKKDGAVEKKVGRRRGPLLPEQRKQASEIRKLRACLRCKFLKKTCDKGEPCAGCQPAHARLWQVPCTRIDIKDIAYFMKDWKADYERHLDRGVSVFNVKGFSQNETLMWITHGYGFCLPVMVREVFVTDENCFQVDWVESCLTDQEPIEFEIRTQKLDVGQEGVSKEALSEYLDKHIDGPFENFIDDHFEGTPFITEIFKTAHRYYQKEKLPVIRKALKLVLAYNLTFHITLVEQPGLPDDNLDGQIDDEDSKYYGKVVAPVMINFQIKCAMADMWRELQKDVLEELSALYSSVYSGERLKNWPTIFMLAAILLAVWELMQFDCHYRVPDPAFVKKFCEDMESTPVGVIVGLFHAISQKLPAFPEWDTRKHGQLLNNNAAVCDAMTEVRQHVLKHGESTPFDQSMECVSY